MRENVSAPKVTYKAEEATYTSKEPTLNGTTSLNVDTIAVVYNIVKALNPKTGKQIGVVSKRIKSKKVISAESFNLTQVSAKDLSKYRRSGVPSFVLKLDNKYYYTSIPENLNFLSVELMDGCHLCSCSCNNLYAKSEEEGGCEKVRNYASNIEKFPWITKGYETFNTHLPVFYVANCLHYKKCAPHKKFSVNEVNNLKVDLADLFWDGDVGSISRLRKRVRSNMAKQSVIDKSRSSRM